MSFILAESCMNIVTLGKLQNFSILLFLHMSNVDNNYSSRVVVRNVCEAVCRESGSQLVSNKY